MADVFAINTDAAKLGPRLARDGTPVLEEGGELTDIFCLACGGEVDDVLGLEGPVLAGNRGGRRA